MPCSFPQKTKRRSTIKQAIHTVFGLPATVNCQTTVINVGTSVTNFPTSLHPQMLPAMSVALHHDAGNLADIPTISPPPSKLSYLLYPGLLLTILLPAYHFVLKDYHAFLALGPGGTPKTFQGYLRVSYLRLFTISDPFRPPPLAEPIYPTNGYLRRLSPRPGPRPTVAGIAPHRQLDQKCTAELHHVLRESLHQLAAAFPSLIRKGDSCFEKHGLALFISASAQSAPSGTAHSGCSHLNPTCNDTGEICHLHHTVCQTALPVSNARVARRRLSKLSSHFKRVTQNLDTDTETPFHGHL